MLLSIVIPTKDRYFSLKSMIMALYQLSLPETEIIVQDNTYDNREFLDFFKNNHFDFVKYYHVKERISVTQNSDLAIQHATGEYICFLGDDDAVSRQIVNVVRYMKDHNIDACCSSVSRYYWPELMEEVKRNNSVELLGINDGSIRSIDPFYELQRILKTAEFSLVGLPKVYQGIVKKTVLDTIWKQTGSFSPGASPDIANAVGVCLTAKKCIFINSPIIIAGFSKKSASGMGATKRHVNKIENVPWLDKSVKNNWDERIPPIWTGQTIWAESMIKALEKMGREDLVDRFNFKRLYSSFVVSHRDLLQYVFETKGKNKYWFLIDFPIYVLQKILQKLHKKVSGANPVVLSKSIVKIDKAVNIISNYIEQYPIQFEKTVENNNEKNRN